MSAGSIAREISQLTVEETEQRIMSQLKVSARSGYLAVNDSKGRQERLNRLYEEIDRRELVYNKKS